MDFSVWCREAGALSREERGAGAISFRSKRFRLAGLPGPVSTALPLFSPRVCPALCYRVGVGEGAGGEGSLRAVSLPQDGHGPLPVPALREPCFEELPTCEIVFNKQASQRRGGKEPACQDVLEEISRKLQ